MEQKTITYKTLFDDVTKDVEEIKLDTIYSCDTIEIETPSGWTPIVGVMKKNGKGIRIYTESGKVFHGEEKHLILGIEGWVFLKDAEFVVNKDNIPEKVVKKELTGETDFYDISLPPPHLYYSPNGLVHHNTHVVTKTLQSAGLVKGKDWFVVKGKITTSSLYQTLFMHRKGGILLFDDTDSIWKDSEAANILKAALDSYDTRMVSWLSMRTVNVSKMQDDEKEAFNDTVDDQILNDPESSKIKFPSEFNFEGRILFISNLSHNDFDSAVLTRTASIDMTLTRDQMFTRMEGILENLGEDGVPLEEKKKILDFLKTRSAEGGLSSLSMRTFVAAENLYLSGKPNWIELLDYVG